MDKNIEYLMSDQESNKAAKIIAEDTFTINNPDCENCGS